MFFYSKGCQTLEQPAQESGWVTIPRSVQKSVDMAQKDDV